jgi:hypothetical protein
MRSIVLKYGVLSGAILGAFMFATMPFHEQIGFSALGMAIGYTSMLLGFLMVHIGMKTYRDTVGGGQVSYGQALVVGLLIMLIGSLIYGACWEVLYATVFSNFAEKYAEFAVAQAQAAGKSPEAIAKLSADMQAFVVQYKQPLTRFGMTLLEPLPVGLLYAFISAWLVSRKRGAEPVRMATA